MPYVKQEARGVDENSGSGKLNYEVTKLVIAFLGREPRYADFNAAIGALECAKLELYRRAVAPYENSKISENGDVYPVELGGYTGTGMDADCTAGAER